MRLHVGVAKALLYNSKNDRILLANPEMSFYCTHIRFWMYKAKINYNTGTAGIYVCPDVCHEGFFTRI